MLTSESDLRGYRRVETTKPTDGELSRNEKNLSRNEETPKNGRRKRFKEKKRRGPENPDLLYL